MSSKKTKASDYDASKIQVIEGLEAVRKRPAMYIGSTSTDGLHHLVYEVVDNSVDEALAGFCSNILVTILGNNAITVEDDGRGIPVDMHQQEGRPAAEVVMTTLHAGGKFDHDSYKVSGGLHGVGVSVVNALSETLELEIWRDEATYIQSYARGKVTSALEVVGKTKKTGTKVTFLPDAQIFTETVFHFDTLVSRLRELAFLNRGLRIRLVDEREEEPRETEFYYAGGIASFVESLNKNRTPLHAKPIAFREESDHIVVDIAMQYNDGYSEQLFSYVNNINTREGGTHLTGFRTALTRTVNAYLQASAKGKEVKALQGEDVREGLVAVISCLVPEPQFEGQTKNKLGNSEVSSPSSSRRIRSPPTRSSPRRPRRRERATRRGRRATSRAARAPWTPRRYQASWPIAKSARRNGPSFSWWRGTPPGAPPNRDVIAERRPCYPCAARCSTSSACGWIRCSTTTRSEP